MFTYNHPPSPHLRAHAYYHRNQCTFFAHESRSTPTQGSDRGGLSHSRSLATTQHTGALRYSGSPRVLTLEDVGVVSRALDGENWLESSFASWIWNPTLNMCKKSFRKCFWTVATLLSLCGMTSSVCMLAKNLFANTPDSPIATFISVFIVVVQLCLLLIFFYFFTYSRRIEPETLQWMWYQLTSLCKAINETLHSSWVCVVPTGWYIMRWVRAGVLTGGLSQWFGSQFVRLGNQVVWIGKIMAREIEPATPPVATVTMVSTEIQTKSEAATETVTEPTSPVQQRASVVPSCSSKSAPATNTMTPTARASSTSVSTQTTTVRMPTQTRSTPSTGPIRRRTTAARTTATQTMTVSVMTNATQTEERVAPQPALVLMVYQGVQDEPINEPSIPPVRYTDTGCDPIEEFSVAPTEETTPVTTALVTAAGSTLAAPPNPTPASGALVSTRGIKKTPGVSSRTKGSSKITRPVSGLPLTASLRQFELEAGPSSPAPVTATAPLVESVPVAAPTTPQQSQCRKEEAKARAQSLEETPAVEDGYVEGEMTDVPTEERPVVEEDEAMSEAPSSEASTNASPTEGTFTTEVNVEMSDADVEPEAPVDEAMTDAGTNAQEDDEMLPEAQEEPPATTTGLAPTAAAAPIAPTPTPAPTTTTPTTTTTATTVAPNFVFGNSSGATLLHTIFTPALNTTPTAMPSLTISNSRGTQGAGNNPAGRMTDKQLAAILFSVSAAAPTSQQATKARTSSTTTNLPAPDLTEDPMYPGWAQSQAAQVQARNREIQRLAQAEEREREWLAEILNQKEDERADRELKRQVMAQLREDNERAEQGDNVIHREPEDDHQEAYELDEKYIAKSPRSRNLIEYERFLKDMTPEKFLAVWSLYPAPESEYRDLAECVRLVLTEGPRTLVALAKTKYYLRSPKFESRIFWDKLLRLQSQGNNSKVAQTPRAPVPQKAPPRPTVPRYTPNQAPNFALLTRPSIGPQPGPNYGPNQPQYRGSGLPNTGFGL